MEETDDKIDILQLLPEEVALDILNLLDDKTLINCTSVSIYWNYLCYSTKKLESRIRSYLPGFEETSKPKSGTSTMLQSSPGVVMPSRQNPCGNEVRPCLVLLSKFPNMNMFRRLKRRRTKTARPSRVFGSIKFTDV